MTSNDVLARELLVGAVSYHDHYGWEKTGGVGTTCQATYDSEEIVRSAAQAGMSAVVLRNLYFNSSGDAFLLQKLVPNIAIIGGIFLNSEVGGINPIAVETAMTYGTGARFVCLATDSAAHRARLAGVREEVIRADPVRYVTPFGADGDITVPMQEVLSIVAAHDVLLETGTLPPEEIIQVLVAAKVAGVKKVLVTHPTPWFCGMTIDQMKAAIELGAKIEFTWIFYTHAMSFYARRFGGTGDARPRPEDLGSAVDQILALGPEHCVLSTDLGTFELPLPVEGLRQFVFCLLDLGITADQISVMIRDNPAQLLGI